MFVDQSCLTLCHPVNCSPPNSSDSRNTGVGCYSLLQRVFLTQGLNLGLLLCRQILYHLSYREVHTPVGRVRSKWYCPNCAGWEADPRKVSPSPKGSSLESSKSLELICCPAAPRTPRPWESYQAVMDLFFWRAEIVTSVLWVLLRCH